MTDNQDQGVSEAAENAETDPAESYIVVPDDDPVFGAPDSETGSFEGLLSALPLRRMGWENFERLLIQLAREVDGLREVRRYGSAGQEQHGIDVVGFTPGDRNPIAYQGKEVERFDEEELRKAVEKFLNGRRPFGVKSLRICTSQYMERTQAQELLNAFQRANPDVSLRLWDAEVINEHLRVRPTIVERFFGREARGRFCLTTSFFATASESDVSADQISLSLVMRGPLNALGLAGHVATADSILDSDPVRAAEIYFEVSESLRQNGYAAFGHYLMNRAIEGYLGADEAERALPLLQVLISEHLWNGHPNRAHQPLMRLQATLGMEMFIPVPEEVAELGQDSPFRSDALTIAMLLTSAHDLLSDPIPLADQADVAEGIYDRIKVALDALDAPDSSSFYRSAWQSVGVCSAIILNFVNALDGPRLTVEQSGWFSELTNRIAVMPNGDFAELQLQVQMSAADLSENPATSWASLYNSANSWALDASASALVYSRYANRVINDGQPELADDLFRRAIERGIESNRFKDTAEWIEARERVRSQFGIFLTDSEDRLRMARILRDRQGKSAATRIDGLISDSREGLRKDKLRSAVLYAVRACVEARTNGFWQSELEARQLCSDAYERSGEGDSAAYFAISSTDPKVARNCGSKLTEYVDTSELLAARSRLRKIAAIELTAAEADLLPDDAVDGVLRMAADFVIELRTADPRPIPVFGRNVYFVVFNLIAALIDRASTASAGWVLDAIESLEERAPGAHYHSDQPMANILGELMSRSDSGLRDRAEPLLRSVISANPRSVQPAYLAIAAKAVPTLIARLLLPFVGGSGENPRAVARIAIESGVVVADHVSPQLEEDSIKELAGAVRKHASVARDSLLGLPAGSPNGGAVFTNLASDALFTTALPSEERIRIVNHLMLRCADELHSRTSRFSMLTALQVLAVGAVGDELGSEVLKSMFDLGVAFAQGGNARAPFEFETGPLDSLRIEWGPESVSVSGLELANVSARDEAQKRRIDQLIESLPSRSLNNFQGSAIASIIAPRRYNIRADSTLGVRTLARLGTETLRAAAAVRWVFTMGLTTSTSMTEEDLQIGVDLAVDESHLVRRSLARSLRQARVNGEELSSHSVLAEGFLKVDKLWSVRKALSR